MLVPPTLFKYEPCTAQALQNLKNQVIYFGSPLNFNDPYDCALSPNIKHLSDSDVNTILNNYLSRATLDDKTKTELRHASIEKLRASFLKGGQDALSQIIQQFMANRGVSCFSESKDNLLMWSHYASNAKGFCLEFETSCDPFQKIRKVNYQTEMPTIDIVPIICGDSSEQALNLYCTKALDWSYEREWRCIHDKAGTEYCYPPQALKAVYMGPEIPPSTFEIIALILRSQNKKVQLWMGSRSKSKFCVEFKQVTYTPHLEAT